MENHGKFIDIHTHAGAPNGGIRILCLDAGNFDPANLNVEFLSVGMHPWTLDKTDIAGALARVREMASRRNVLAIGECGLDLLARAPRPLQEEAFRRQMEIADAFGKPLIIHCVRAHNELMRIWRSAKPKIPFIIHAYDNNAQIARQLLKCGFYLSFGKALLKPAANAARVIGECPAERLFLETDDSGIAIETVYEAAARYRNMGMEALKAAIMANFEAVFGDEWADSGGAHARPLRPGPRS